MVDGTAWSSQGGRWIRSADWPDGTHVQWAPSGDALTYIHDVDGVSNIWSMPLAGGKCHQITDFTTGSIAEYTWSVDGKRLVFTRGEVITDVVLITNFK